MPSGTSCVGDIAAIGGLGRAAVEALDDRVAIDGVHHRLADVHVLPERDFMVEADIVDDEGVAFDDLEVLVALEGRRRRRARHR